MATPDRLALSSAVPETKEGMTAPEQASRLLSANLPRERGTEDVLDDVRQFISETDEAFKLQDPFTEVRLPSPLVVAFQPTEPLPTMTPLGLAPIPTRTMSARKKANRLSQSSLNTRPKKSTLLSGPERNPSITKTKRRGSKKSRRRQRMATRQTTSSKRTLAETAKELFAVHLFNRIEADEMLPESKLQEIRTRRSHQGSRSQGSFSSISSSVRTASSADAADTPLEPFHLDDLPRRVDAAGVNLNVPQTIEEIGTPRSSISNRREEASEDGGCVTPKNEAPPQFHQSPELRQEESQLPRVMQQQRTPITVVAEEDDEQALPIMIFVEEEKEEKTPIKAGSKSITFPPNSIRSVPRRYPTRQLPPLPTIPEVISVGPDNILSPTSAPAPQPAESTINTEDYVFLPSNPFTLTVPTFRHGFIRLAKADLPIGKLAAAVDDTLDWTAFQMAILGGAGDFFSEPTDFSRPSDTDLDELDDLHAWFTSFGYASAGALISAEDAGHDAKTARLENRRRRRRRASSGSPSGSGGSSNGSPRTRQGRRSHEARHLAVEQGYVGGETPRIHQSSRQQQHGYHHGHARSSSTGSAHQQSTNILGIVAPRSPYKGNGAERQSRRQENKVLLETPGSTGVGIFNNNKKNRDSGSSSSTQRPHVGLEIDLNATSPTGSASQRRPSTESVQSLPQSPMLDLVTSHDVEGNEYTVPMGFNLGHDLGDFLRWEAEHVYATGYQ